MEVKTISCITQEGKEEDLINFSIELAELMRKYGVTSIFQNWANKSYLPKISVDDKRIVLKNFVVRFK